MEQVFSTQFSYMHRLVGDMGWSGNVKTCATLTQPLPIAIGIAFMCQVTGHNSANQSRVCWLCLELSFKKKMHAGFVANWTLLIKIFTTSALAVGTAMPLCEHTKCKAMTEWRWCAFRATQHEGTACTLWTACPVCLTRCEWNQNERFFSAKKDAGGWEWPKKMMVSKRKMLKGWKICWLFWFTETKELPSFVFCHDVETSVNWHSESTHKELVACHSFLEALSAKLDHHHSRQLKIGEQWWFESGIQKTQWKRAIVAWPYSSTIWWLAEHAFHSAESEMDGSLSSIVLEQWMWTFT